VTAITATLIALTWLPVVVKVYTLVGGSVKTPVGEVTSRGLQDLANDLPPDARRAALATWTATADLAAETATGGEREEAVAVRQELKRQLTALRLPPEQAQGRLEVLAMQYDCLRQTVPSGPERTLRMSALVAEARTIVRQGVVGQPVIEEWLEGFKQEPDEGKRVIGLALIQEAPAPGRFFDAALNALSHSRTAFEQYQACSPSIAWSPSLIRTSKPSLRPPWRISEAVGRASTSRQKPTAGRSVAGSLPSSDPTDKLCRRGRELNASPCLSG
jgi:hypothetical protein